MKRITITMMSGPYDGKATVFEPRLENPPFALTLGRRDSCDISLAFDTQVSRAHAKILFDGFAFKLEDLGSRNGTFVGAERIEGTVEIAPGTLFRIGRTWLQIEPLPSDETQGARPIFDDDSSIF